MADQADLRSLEQLDGLHQHMSEFRVQLKKELDLLEVELRRLTRWIIDDAYSYWSGELRGAERQRRACQDALTRCLSYVRSDERRPCTEEKKRLRRAEQRRELCEQKMKYHRAAADQWERQLLKLRTRLKRCHELAEGELLVAVNQLQRQLDMLRQYTGLRSTANVQAPLRQPRPIDATTNEHSAPDRPSQDNPPGV